MIDSAPRLDQRRRRGVAPVLLILGLAAAARAQSPASPPGSPVLIYLPPTPPPMGAAPPAPAPVPAGQWAAPPALAAFVDDCFYAPLSTRLARNDVGADVQFRLDSYLASKVALQAELQAKLDTLKDATPEARRQNLEAFAREQTPRIAELEIAAEQLRRDLVHSRTDQREYLRWQIDFASQPAADATNVDARFREVVQMDAYYHEGLSPDQRCLLREIALEKTGGGEAFLFSPAGARVSLPANLPPALAAKITAYGTEKSALKADLLATLHPHQKTPADPTHVLAVRALAAAQAPRFAQLESQAEDIRRGLAVLQDPAHGPDLPPVPPELSARIAAYHRDKLALQQELMAKLDGVKAAMPAGTTDMGERIKEAIAAFTQANAMRYSTLEQGRDAIHRDLSRLPDNAAGGAPATAADALLKNFSDSLRHLQSYWNYRDYQTAVLQPGLSPEQRRLLFDGALEKLALPLPGAETDPGRR